MAKMWRLPALVATELARRSKTAEDWPTAARSYRIALVFDPRNAATLVQYGNALRECGTLGAAEDAYRRSLQRDPGVPDAHLQLGHALKLQRRFADAVEAYRRAIELDPLLYDASVELLALGHTMHVERSALPAAGPDAEPGCSRQLPLIVFDASDLLRHLLHSRSATGIQRVQICVIASVLRAPDPEFEFAISYFRERPDEFVAVPADFFLHLVELAQSPRSPDLAWRQSVQQLIALSVHGKALQFRDGAVLINLGTSWTLGNYFLTIRMLKARYRLRYVPFVHDCIPALFPDLCATQTVRDYLGWIAGVFRHADGFLVNSSTTARDLTGVGAALGQPVAATRRVVLDAGFQRDGMTPLGQVMIAPGRRRDREPFILFVASFELRKNHQAAFRAWAELIGRRGRRNVPLLVCAGGRGWQSDATMRLLRSSRVLRNRVRILSGVSDAALDALYRDCLFTLYPSLYEGWGLPVTESLAYGKVPLIADVPALRESGGDLAEYFNPAMHDDLVAKVRRLIDDQPYLLRREAKIRQEFKGRQWSEVAQDILNSARPIVESRTGTDRPVISNDCSAPVEVGRYYPIARNIETRLGPGLGSGEIYRSGEGWWAPEEWGCWLKAGRADLALRLPDDAGETWLHLDLEGNPGNASEIAVSTAGRSPTVTSKMAPKERRQIAIRVDSPRISNCLATISIDASGSCVLGETADGLDQRVVSIGMRGFTLLPSSSIAAAAGVTAQRAAIRG
jgi:glycosyltransferase involved in cell wall biosynthesis